MNKQCPRCLSSSFKLLSELTGCQFCHDQNVKKTKVRMVLPPIKSPVGLHMYYVAITQKQD